MATQSGGYRLSTGIGRLALLALALTVSAGTLQGQHLISTKAGFVNRADGRVFITRQDSVDDERGRALMGTQMRRGDLLATEAASFAEVLLNPGTYLRLDEKSSIRAIDTSLTSINFELISGSAILEVGEIDKQTPIRIGTPNGAFFARRDGLVRFDLIAGATRVSVRQGEIRTGTREQVLANEGEKVGRGKVALFKASVLPELAKIDRDAYDDFDVWSFGRARTLVEANSSALSQSRSAGSLASGWIFDPLSGSYTFIPRNGLFWSAYGFSFFNSFGDCFTCLNSLLYRNLYSMYGYGQRGVNSGSGVLPPYNPSTPGRVITGSDRSVIQRDMENRRISVMGQGMDSGIGQGPGRGIGGMGDGMSRSTGMSAPVILASPAPSRGGMGGMDGGMGGGVAPGGGAPSRPSRN
ncbi:MAG: hypothetical protein RIR52_2116 [Acidobacteriota bacterium]|jgi:hypothetical protein